MSSWKDNLRTIDPYVPGEQPQLSDMIKLNTNENPYPPSPKARDVLTNFALDTLRLYPDPDSSLLVKMCIRDRYGAENVYDFSLGNPSTLPPKEVNEAIIDIASNEDPNRLHGYMNNSGFEDVREAIAQSLNKRFDTHFSQKNILMTVGAAGGLNVILKSIIDPEDEVIAFAPYFGAVSYTHLDVYKRQPDI